MIIANHPLHRSGRALLTHPALALGSVWLEPKSQLWTRMFHFYMMNRPQFLEHYPAKSKLTQKGNVWLDPSQAGNGEYEVRPDPQAPRCTSLCKVLCHNFCVVGVYYLRHDCEL